MRLNRENLTPYAMSQHILQSAYRWLQFCKVIHIKVGNVTDWAFKQDSEADRAVFQPPVDALEGVISKGIADLEALLLEHLGRSHEEVMADMTDIHFRLSGRSKDDLLEENKRLRAFVAASAEFAERHRLYLEAHFEEDADILLMREQFLKFNASCLEHLKPDPLAYIRKPLADPKG